MDPPYSLDNNNYRFKIDYYTDPQTSQAVSVTKISDSDGNMNYVAISGTKKVNINSLYQVLLEFSSRHPLCLPEMLLPQRIPGKGTLIPAKCFIYKSLAEFDKTWFFETVSLYDQTTGLSQQKSLYLTTQFKCVLYSIIRQVILSVDEKKELQDIYPVIDLNQMFVTPANGIIFTKYHQHHQGHKGLFSASEHNFDSEIDKLVDLLDTIFRKHGDNSPTLEAEIDDLKRFLKYAENSKKVLQDVLKQIVFWNRRMRIQYICKLVECVLSDDILEPEWTNVGVIFNYSRPAFHTVYNQGEWVQTFENCKNPILQKVFNLGNRYIDENAQKILNKYRTRDMKDQTDLFKFISGLVRLRDVLTHIDDYNIHEHNRIVTDVDMQAIFQDIFPRHMVDFKRSLDYVSGFNVKVLVMSLLGLSQDEA